MRAFLSSLVIVSICLQLGSSVLQTNIAERNSQRSTGNKFESVGQQEYYIPSYRESQQQKPREYIYPKNLENAYQFSQYNSYANRVPLLRQRLWAAESIHPFGNYNSKSYYGRNIDVNEGDNSNSKDLQNENESRGAIINTNNKLKASIIDHKLKEFNDEQQNLVKSVNHNIQNEGTNEDVIGPLMRRKSQIKDGSAQSSSRHTVNEQSIPIPLARQQQNANNDNSRIASLGDVYFVAIVACISAVSIFAVTAAGYCFYKIKQTNKAAADVDYPAYGVVGPVSKETNTSGNTSPVGDRKLAQSAQMYHYHHQKQQMIASEKAVTPRHTSASDVESDEENEEGDYTVYECPGLAPTGEMEVKNPLFHDDVTPISSPQVNGNAKENK